MVAIYFSDIDNSKCYQATSNVLVLSAIFVVPSNLTNIFRAKDGILYSDEDKVPYYSTVQNWYK